MAGITVEAAIGRVPMRRATTTDGGVGVDIDDGARRVRHQVYKATGAERHAAANCNVADSLIDDARTCRDESAVLYCQRAGQHRQVLNGTAGHVQ